MSSFFDQYDVISRSNLFDGVYYLKNNEDVALEHADPVTHYLEIGAKQGRKPSASFDVDFYRQQCAALGQQMENPLLHYLEWGQHHGLKTSATLGRLPPPMQPKPPALKHETSKPNLRSMQAGETRLDRITLTKDGHFHISGMTADRGQLECVELFSDVGLLGNAAIENIEDDDNGVGHTVANLHRFSFRGLLGQKIDSGSFRIGLRIVRQQGRATHTAVRCFVQSGRDNLIKKAEPDTDVRIFLDTPGLLALDRIVVNDDLPIRGWALGRAGIEKIEIRVDGTPVTTITTRIAREDVMAIHSDYKNSLRCGFETRLLRTALPSAEHLVEVRAVDPKGIWTAIEFGVTVQGRKPEQTPAAGVSINIVDDKLSGELLAQVSQLLDENSQRLDHLAPKLDASAAGLVAPLSSDNHLLKSILEILSGALTAGSLSGNTLEEIASLLSRRATRPLMSSVADGNRSRFEDLIFLKCENPKVSILIPAFNNFYFTHACLKSIIDNPPLVSYEVILVDDASTDETVRAAEIIQGISIVRSESNLGFIHSCNVGAKLARGQFLMLLNNDALLTSGAVDELVNTFEDPNVGLAGSKLVFPDGRLQEAGGIIWRDASGSNYGRGEDASASDYNYCRSVDYCSGAALMIPTTLWNRLDGLDYHFAPAYYEDTDLAFRVRRLGLDVCYQPFSRVIHREGISSGKAVDQGIKAMQPRNRELFRARWADVLTLHSDSKQDISKSRDHGVKKRALFIDATTPTPDQDAGSTVAVAHMNILQQLGYKVSFLPNNHLDYDRKYTPPLQRAGIEAIYHPRFNSLSQLLEERGGEFDLVYVHRYMVAEEAIPLIRKLAPQAFLIFNNADLHFLRMIRELKISPSRDRLAKAMEVKEKEFNAIREADCTLICNMAEVDIISKELPTAKLHYLPWVITASTLIDDYEDRNGFMFLGGFGHSPNVDAVKYFCATVMPILRKLLPGITFHVYGSNVPDEIYALAAEDIKIEGFIQNLEVAFKRHRVSVAPIRFGAGFKGKIAASLAHGVPVVASKLAAEGTGLQNGQELVIADEPLAFGKSIAELYTTKQYWERLRFQGRQYVTQHYSMRRAKEHFSEVLEKHQC